MNALRRARYALRRAEERSDLRAAEAARARMDEARESLKRKRLLLRRLLREDAERFRGGPGSRGPRGRDRGRGPARDEITGDEEPEGMEDADADSGNDDGGGGDGSGDAGPSGD